MIILTTQIEQAFTVIPKKSSWSILSLQFQNEITKAIYEVDIETIVFIKDVLWIASISLNFLKQNEFYILKIFIDDDSQEVFYKDRVFVTNQSQSTYSINNGQYTSTSIDNNNYITI